MAYDTYDDLVSSIGNYLKEDNLQSEIGDLILLFESVEGAKLKHAYSQVLTTIQISDRDTVLPADCASVRAFGEEGKKYMDQISIERISEMYTQSRKQNYAVIGTTTGQTLRMPTTPEQPFTAEILYRTKLTPLSSAASNWLYDNYPMVYLYGTLLRAEAYLENDGRIATWSALYQQAIAAMETDDRNIEHGAQMRSMVRTRTRI